MKSCLFGLLGCLWIVASATAQELGAIRPFTIEIGQDVLDDLDDRLDRTRWPHQVDGSGWNHGPDLRWMKSLVAYWKDGYDWRIEEQRLNAFPQFTTEIDGLDLHLVLLLFVFLGFLGHLVGVLGALSVSLGCGKSFGFCGSLGGRFVAKRATVGRDLWCLGTCSRRR